MRMSKEIRSNKISERDIWDYRGRYIGEWGSDCCNVDYRKSGEDIMLFIFKNNGDKR